jgi:hypothetical protein
MDQEPKPEPKAPQTEEQEPPPPFDPDPDLVTYLERGGRNDAPRRFREAMRKLSESGNY